MTKKRHLSSNGARAVLILLLLAVGGCDFSSASIEYKRGRDAEQKRRFDSAVEHYRKVVRRSPESDIGIAAAREAARISMFETKNFKDAVEFYTHLIQFSSSEKERRESQEKVASIHFEKLNDFKKSIGEYNRLLMLRNTTDEIINYRFQLARAHFNMTQFEEARTEASEAAKLVALEDPRRFEILMFLGSVYFNTKKVEEAINTYKEVIKSYPERAAQENVAMNVIVCHEELEQFDQAIAGLRAIRPHYADPEFIDLKIKRLLARKANLPGSKGLRK